MVRGSPQQTTFPYKTKPPALKNIMEVYKLLRHNYEKAQINMPVKVTSTSNHHILPSSYTATHKTKTLLLGRGRGLRTTNFSCKEYGAVCSGAIIIRQI